MVVKTNRQEQRRRAFKQGGHGTGDVVLGGSSTLPSSLAKVLEAKEEKEGKEGKEGG